MTELTLTTQPDGQVSKAGDRIFKGLSTGAGILILITLAGIALFLAIEAWPALVADPSEFSDGDNFLQFVGPLVFGTLLASALALIIATPLAISVALFITQDAPPRLSKAFGYFVDLLAAIPSVVFGLWGINTFAPLLADEVYPLLNSKLGWIPFFGGTVVPSGRSLLTATLVLAVMILPIITAISREVFLQTPRLHKEASLALGATRWEMITQAVLPYGRSGIISGAMLGLGRALGETMAVAMILSPADVYSIRLLTSENPNTIAANIALRFPDSAGLEVNRLIATGLVLFVITFIVNVLARKMATKGVSL
ncbi:MAG: phosphate ABC transporter permease subunit PstC [Ilumatobacter coccineus]|uniref:Phosphate transport system permease protein n=1 Tax=Ilumatobacter coccineus TaxID=467094 RepID=A0A2G6KFI2_9ACTN|nr:MAG: phosphate ABC transporter permease subunit PstC [Ilumatobacter coccineus]